MLLVIVRRSAFTCTVEIGAVTRSVYPASGGRKTFISGYSNDVLPNIWN
ncbi:MAG: 3-mercaptopropionate dioxygenase, partial [Paraburkholderia sp.]|nr:3-mercaptopropionate dioxygenase [Paraburkholderia sp.]